MGPCTCDLTYNVCDNFCCCDADCPVNLIMTWNSSFFSQCKDKKKSQYELNTQCNSDETNYIYNRNVTMTSYRLPLSNLFCVKYDNSDIKGQFYDFLTYNPTEYDIILQQKRADQLTTNYPLYYDNAYIKPNAASYQFGDELQVKSSSYVTKYRRFLLPSPGPFGDCKKIYPVKFMVNMEERTCGKMFVIT